MYKDIMNRGENMMARKTNFLVYDKTPTPLRNSAFEVGNLMQYIRQIENEDDREIALCEYYFHSGQNEKAIEIAEKHLNSSNLSLRFSAYIIYFFANLSCNHIHLARYALEQIKDDVERISKYDAPDEIHAIGTYTEIAIAVLMHTPISKIPPLEEYIGYLPGGHKLFAYYIMAHKVYLEGDYRKSLGIIESALCIYRKMYPIPGIYLHIMAAINHINLREVEKAKEHFLKAWEYAEPDDLIAAFGQHHALLQGLNEVMFKKEHPKLYKKIKSLASDFSEGWTRLHNHDNDRQIANNLTPVEISIAMLYKKGWTMKAIGNYLGLSDRTIGNYIQIIYAKLGITSKSELVDYMLK